jgi:hypothetical protein
MRATGIEDWLCHFEEEIENLKLRFAEKADRVFVEQIIWRQQNDHLHDEVSAPVIIARDSSLLLDPEYVCAGLVQSGELPLAFATVVRHFTAVANTKAERHDVLGKVTKAYTDGLIERLTLIAGHEIDDATESLQAALTKRLQSFHDEFRRSRTTVEDGLAALEVEVGALNAGLGQLRRCRDLPFESRGKIATGEETQQLQTGITPRRQALHRSLEKFHKRVVQYGQEKFAGKNPELGETIVISQTGK